MSKENCVCKLKIELELEIAQILDGQSKICNWLYNQLIVETHTLKQKFQGGEREAAKIIYSKRGLRNLLPKWKKEHPFLQVVHSSPLKNTALRCSEAIDAYQKSKKGQRKGKEIGWPNFRKWRSQWFSLLYNEPNKGFSIEGQTLILSLGMGEDRKRRSLQVTIPDAHLLKGKCIRNLRITSEFGEYYAVFTIAQEEKVKKPITKVIALDPNHKNLAYGVGTDQKAVEIAAPLWLKNYDKRIDELKSKRDRCAKKAKKIQMVNAKGEPLKKRFFFLQKDGKS